MRKPLPPEYRDWLIVRMTGWTEEQILDQRAQWLDWMLEIQRLHTELAEEE